MTTARSNQCELCGREMSRLTRHHLIPRSRHSNRRNKRRFDREDVRTRLLNLCRACHGQIHAALTNKELEYDYNGGSRPPGSAPEGSLEPEQACIRRAIGR